MNESEIKKQIIATNNMLVHLANICMDYVRSKKEDSELFDNYRDSITDLMMSIPDNKGEVFYGIVFSMAQTIFNDLMLDNDFFSLGIKEE